MKARPYWSISAGSAGNGTSSGACGSSVTTAIGPPPRGCMRPVTSLVPVATGTRSDSGASDAGGAGRIPTAAAGGNGHQRHRNEERRKVKATVEVEGDDGRMS